MLVKYKLMFVVSALMPYIWALSDIWALSHIWARPLVVTLMFVVSEAIVHYLCLAPLLLRAALPLMCVCV